MPAESALQVGFGTPFEEQIAFLRRKLQLPTEKWDDIARSAHDRAFMVAGVTKADLLSDLRNAVLGTATDGTGLQAFRKDFKAIVAKHGWTGWTGEGTKGGEAWRTRVIYQTNMSTSYSAGRFKQLMDPDFLEARPYWRYLHSDNVAHPRPYHLAWHGITLPATHVFWKTHFTPNGWGCECRIAAVTKAEGLASEKAGLGEPPEGWDKIDPKTQAPVGIDRGFDYAPGAAVDVPLRQMVQDKLITYPDAIARALSADVGRYINTAEVASTFASRVLADRSVTEPLWLGFVENAAEVSVPAGEDVKGFFVTLPAEAPRHVESSHAFDGKGQRPAVPADYDRIAEVLNQADSLRSGSDTSTGTATVLALKKFGEETYRAVFEVLPGKRNKALALKSLVIRTGK